MDSPNPDSGEEYFHTNTQLYGVLDDHNRFKIGEAAAAPWNAPPPGAVRLTGEVAGLDEATVTAARGQDIVRWAKEEE